MIRITYARDGILKEFAINKELTIEEAMTEVYAFLVGVKLSDQVLDEGEETQYSA
jgi:hypothetical protein